MVKIMTVIDMVPIRDFFIISQFSPLYKAAIITVPTTPIAAASDGVAIPKKITPSTRKTIKPNGSTYLIVATIFCDKGVGVTS